jgi:hypothetical protein
MPTTTLADTIIAACAAGGKNVEPAFGDPSERRKAGGGIRDRMIGSRRYYLDDEATLAITTLGVQHPDLLLEMLRRARAPFEKVWIEWPTKAQADAIGRPHLEGTPERTGALIERLDAERPLYRMTEIGTTTSDTVQAGPMSVVYDLLDPPPLAPISDRSLISQFVSDDPTMMNRLLIGSAYVGKLVDGKPEAIDDPDELRHREVQCDRLAGHATFMFSPLGGHLYKERLENRYDRWHDITVRVLRESFQEQAGSWRFIIAALALINANDLIVRSDPWRIGRSRMVSGKVLPYLEHYTIGLKLPRKNVEQRAVRMFGENLPKRRHEVSGHFRQSRKQGDPDCSHVWVEETETREVCAVCAAKRWWVNDFERGDATLGYVTKDRAVTR